jgi:hypothetical protein
VETKTTGIRDTPKNTTALSAKDTSAMTTKKRDEVQIDDPYERIPDCGESHVLPKTLLAMDIILVSFLFLQVL